MIVVSFDMRLLRHEKADSLAGMTNKKSKVAKKGRKDVFAFGDHVEKELVDAEIVAQFGMEGGGQRKMTFADKGWIVAAAGDGFDAGAGVGDARGWM